MTENEVRAEYEKWKTGTCALIVRDDEKKRAEEEFAYIEKSGLIGTAVLFSRVMDIIRNEKIDVKVVTPWAVSLLKTVDRNAFCRHLFYLRTKGRMFFNRRTSLIFSFSSETKNTDEMNGLFEHMKGIITSTAEELGLEYTDEPENEELSFPYSRYGWISVDGPEGAEGTRHAAFDIRVHSTIPKE